MEVRKDESKRKREADARKRQKAVTKWEGIRQTEASAEGGAERGNAVGGCTTLPRKRYPLMHGTFNSIPRCGGRREELS